MEIMAGNWREQKKTQLRENLYAVSLKLVRDRGYEHTTVQQITERAGVAKGTFFNHFPSKEHVLAAWYRQLTLDALTEVRGAGHPTAEGAILALMDNLTERVSKQAKLLEMKARNPSDLLSDEERALDAELDSFFCEQLQVGKQRGELDPKLNVKFLSSFIITVMTGTAREWHLSGHGFDVKETIRGYIQYILAAAKPTQARATRKS
jgi:AcrR family transcriptional regulator